MSEIIGLPHKEQENLQLFEARLFNAAEKLKHCISIDVVGGAKTKPWPRKDIDLLIKIFNLKGKLKGNEYEKATQAYKVLSEIVEKACSYGNEFAISEYINPYIDPEFNSESILAHDGSIKVQPSDGTIIEVIRDRLDS